MTQMRPSTSKTEEGGGDYPIVANSLLPNIFRKEGICDIVAVASTGEICGISKGEKESNGVVFSMTNPARNESNGMNQPIHFIAFMQSGGIFRAFQV